MKFFNRYNHPSPASPHGGVSLTDKQFAADCDINTILVRFQATGALPSNTRGEGTYGDFSKVGEFGEVMERVNKARDYFASLPSAIRARFGNEPTAFYDYVLDPANKEECIKLGLREVVEAKETSVDVLKRIEKVVTPKGAAPSSGGDGNAE